MLQSLYMSHSNLYGRIILITTTLFQITLAYKNHAHFLFVMDRNTESIISSLTQVHPHVDQNKNGDHPNLTHFTWPSLQWLRPCTSRPSTNPTALNCSTVRSAPHALTEAQAHSMGAERCEFWRIGFRSRNNNPESAGWHEVAPWRTSNLAIISHLKRSPSARQQKWGYWMDTRAINRTVPNGVDPIVASLSVGCAKQSDQLAINDQRITTATTTTTTCRCRNMDGVSRSMVVLLIQ